MRFGYLISRPSSALAHGKSVTNLRNQVRNVRNPESTTNMSMRSSPQSSNVELKACNIDYEKTRLTRLVENKVNTASVFAKLKLSAPNNLI